MTADPRLNGREPPVTAVAKDGMRNGVITGGHRGRSAWVMLCGTVAALVVSGCASCAWRLPAWWARARRMTQPTAVANRTRWPSDPARQRLRSDGTGRQCARAREAAIIS